MSNCCCGSNSLSMSTSNPNPSLCQSPACCCDGGASGLSSALNVIGKWGSVITAQAQGRPVSVAKGRLQVGAKGASGLPGQFSGMTLILILVIVGGLLFLSSRG